MSNIIWCDRNVRFGSKADMCTQKSMSALPPKADMCSALAHVRFVPIADIAPAELKRASYEPTSEFMLICN
jgi:hypothetical protein